MRRHLFTGASVISLLFCVATVVLWVRGVGRADGWYFKPSPTFHLQPPDEQLPSKWCVQWQIYWGSNAAISISRQFKPIEGQPRVGFATFAMKTRRWNPLPENQPVLDPRIAAMARLPDGRVLNAYRTKPATAWSHLGITYVSREQEFGKFPNFDHYFASLGGWSLRVPLLYLFTLFALLPCLWAIRLYRKWSVREGHCPHCNYNLTGNTSGVCPECGTRVPNKHEPASLSN